MKKFDSKFESLSSHYTAPRMREVNVTPRSVLAASGDGTGTKLDDYEGESLD